MSVHGFEGGVRRWFEDFEGALTARSSDRLAALFSEVSYLRDNGALTYDYMQFHGTDAVVSAILAVQAEIQPRSFLPSRRWPGPRVIGEGAEARLEAFADFETKGVFGTAFFHASLNEESPYGFDVFALFTRIEGVKGTESPAVHPRGPGFEPSYPGETWTDRRNQLREHGDSDPEVLIVGGGQAGLIAAAHLKKLGVDALIVDKHARVGDNWRVRYDSLYLHNPIEMNDFPFLDFPDHYPEYLPKDVIADWLEIYQRYLDLDIWLSTEFTGATFDDDTNRWTATVRRADGTERVMHPKHIVHCTGGFGGRLFFPKLPGVSDFEGTVIHSEQYRRGSDFAGKNAIVVGTATSAHDVAEDLHEYGVNVTMVQRGPVVVTDLSTANELVYAGFLDPDQPTDLVDIRYSMGWIYPLRVKNARRTHQLTLEKDAELHKGLQAAGMVLGDGPKGMGWLGLYWTRGGGYYLNKGASELIISGQIKLLQADKILKFVHNGALLEDGTVLHADLLVFATGYESRIIEIEEFFGEEVSAKLGDVADLDAMGEWRGFWGQSGQRGLWLNGAGINSARPQSGVMALLIKADLDGHIPDSFRRPPQGTSDSRFTPAEVLAP